MARWPGVLLAIGAAALLAPPGASADPDELMPCKIVLIKAPPAAGGNGLTKFVCKGAFTLPSAGAAPGLLGFAVNPVPPGNAGPGTSAVCTGLGNPAGSKGYRCSSSNTPVLLLKTNVVKAVLKFDVPLVANSTPHPYLGDVAVQLVSLGASDQKRYCGRFPLGSALKNDGSQFKAKNAPPPAACSPSGAFLDGGEPL